MTKLEKIDREMQKAQEKLAAMQAKVKEVDEQRIEQENLQIVQQIRALKLTREQLRAFVESGAMPASLSGAITDAGSAGTQRQINEPVDSPLPLEPNIPAIHPEPSDSPEPVEPSDSSKSPSYDNSYSSYNDTSDDDYYRDREDRYGDE